MFSKDGKVKDVATPRICDVVWHDGEFIVKRADPAVLLAHEKEGFLLVGVPLVRDVDGPAQVPAKVVLERIEFLFYEFQD